MTNLIIYYVVLLMYFVFVILYSIRQVRRYKTESKTYNQKELEYDFRSIFLNILLVTVIVLILSVLMIFKHNGKQQLTPPQIGISLACATVLFYVSFLVWDILKGRIHSFFLTKYQTTIRKEVMMGPNVILTISTVSILLLVTILTVIFSFN